MPMPVKKFVVNEEYVVQRPDRRRAENACRKGGVAVQAIRAAHPSEDTSSLKNLDKEVAKAAAAAAAAEEAAAGDGDDAPDADDDDQA